MSFLSKPYVIRGELSLANIQKSCFRISTIFDGLIRGNYDNYRDIPVPQYPSDISHISQPDQEEKIRKNFNLCYKQSLWCKCCFKSTSKSNNRYISSIYAISAKSKGDVRFYFSEYMFYCMDCYFNTVKNNSLYTNKPIKWCNIASDRFIMSLLLLRKKSKYWANLPIDLFKLLFEWCAFMYDLNEEIQYVDINNNHENKHHYIDVDEYNGDYYYYF